MTDERQASNIAWFASIISIIALIISIAAYNRAGKDIQQQLTDQLNVAQEKTTRALALADARARIAALQVRFAADKNYDEAQKEINRIQGNLDDAYKTADSNSKQAYTTITGDLTKLNTALKDKSANVADAFKAALDTFDREINR